MEKKKLRWECRGEGDQINEAADQRKEKASSETGSSATAVDMSSPVMDERPSSELSRFENERDYLPELGSHAEAGPTLVGSHPGSAWRHVPGSRTAYTRTLAAEENTVPDLALVLRTPYLCRCTLRPSFCCAACLFRDSSFC